MIRRSAFLAVVACALAVSGCAPPADVAELPPPLVVGSFDFPESRVLAQVYGQAVRSSQQEVRIEEALGPREVVLPALREGQLDVVPEYVGGLAEAVAPVLLAGDSLLPDLTAVLAQQEDLVLLEPSPAENTNVLVVTRKTAQRLGLRRTSDLLPHDGALALGGPPECGERPYCAAGYRTRYGLVFARFVPLDVGGPVTLRALREGSVDVVVLFSSDPALLDPDLVVLEDDRHLQPPQNIVPAVRRDRLDPEVQRQLDRVSQALTQEALQHLNEQTLAVGTEEAARQWLLEQGLLPSPKPG